MKILFISDIHGIKKNLEFIDKQFEELKCDELVVLGDLYYIGPRNKITEDYDISFVHEFLTKHKEHILCMQGNCDSNVDLKCSDFPVVSELGLILVDGLKLYLTHGHIYNKENTRKYMEEGILIYGHEHVPFIEKLEHGIFINPGSISLSRGENLPTYMIYENRTFTIYDVQNKVIDSITV